MRNFQLPEKLRRSLIPGVLFLSFFLLAGGLYFRNQSLISPPQTSVSEEGTVSGARTGLPKNFPEDIPLFEPTEILSTLESQERVQVTLQTAASTKRVSQFYQQKMEDLGWRLTGRGEDNGILTFLKNDRRTQLVITSEPDGGSTLIILNITP